MNESINLMFLEWLPAVNFFDNIEHQVAVLLNSTEDVEASLDDGCDVNYNETYTQADCQWHGSLRNRSA